MKDINIKYYPADDLVMAEYNPRQLTKDQYTQLKDSIMRFGLVDPLIVNKNKERKNILVGGHQRLRIAKEMGVESIPCVEVDLTLDQEKELNIRLNKNVGEWDFDALANYFDVGELTEWGFSNDDLQFYEDEPKQGLIDDDEIPEVEEPITQAGDLWILGEHRLLCGDATKKEDVDLLMDGQKADMVFTDPPYGMNLDTNTKNIYFGDSKANSEGKFTSKTSSIGARRTTNHKAIIGDDVDFKFKRFYKLVDYVKEQFWFGADYYCQDIPKDGCFLVWDKTGGNESLVNSGFGSNYELAWSKQKHKRDIIKYTYKGVSGMKKEDGLRVHPSQKPVGLCEYFITKWSDEGIKIIDFFLGSGSTLIACEKTNRKCYGMEIDPHYCDVIVKRWEEFSGKKAERVERATA